MPARPISLQLASGGPTSTPPDNRAALVGVVEDLVALLEAQFPTGTEFPAEALRTRLNQARDRLRTSERPDEVSGAGLRLIGDASQAYARLSTHVSAREAEFTGVIRLLRELVDGLRGDALAFRDDLRQSSDRVADLTQIEDIRTLRRALNREVDHLRQCVQQGERRESSRLADVAGELKKVDATIAQATAAKDHPSGLLARPLLLSALLAEPRAPASVVVCRIDEPQAIVDDHGAPVVARVIVALAHLLKGTFGNDAKVYRSGTHCVAMFLPGSTSRQVAQRVRQVQARVAPEYEYERQGVTRRVAFTFSAAITSSAGRTEGDAPEALARAETQAEVVKGVAQLTCESSGFGRLVGWLSSPG